MSYDAIVVGGSFAGLSAAMQLARARRRVLVVDSGLPRNRFAQASHGFFGQDGKAPHDILRAAARQVSAYPTVEFVQGEATGAAQVDGGFTMTLDHEREEQAARLVLATGVRDELPPLPGLQERWGRTVLHCPYCHGYEVAGGALGVLAYDPMSVHKAVLLPDWGKTTLFTQGLFEPDAEQAAQLAGRGVQVERVPVVELLGEAPDLDAVRLADGRVIPLQALFATSAVRMASPLAERLGCEFDQGPFGPYIRVDEWKQTTVAGVYAAGDATAAMHNATLASASGVLAGIGAHQSLAKEIGRAA